MGSKYNRMAFEMKGFNLVSKRLRNHSLETYNRFCHISCFRRKRAKPD
jgi:hypothetical protein